MAPPKTSIRKTVTHKEIKSHRIPLPAAVRDMVCPSVAEKTKTPLVMVDADEKEGGSFNVVLKVRKNKTKPELMAKGFWKYAKKKNLRPGDILIFSKDDSPGHFRVELQRTAALAPGIIGSDPTRKLTPPVAAVPAFRSLIGSNGAPIKLPEMEMAPAVVLGIGLSLVSDHATMKLGKFKAELEEDGPTLQLALGPIQPKDQPTVERSVKTMLPPEPVKGVSAKIVGTPELLKQESQPKLPVTEPFLGARAAIAVLGAGNFPSAFRPWRPLLNKPTPDPPATATALGANILVRSVDNPGAASMSSAAKFDELTAAAALLGLGDPKAAANKLPTPPTEDLPDKQAQAQVKLFGAVISQGME